MIEVFDCEQGSPEWYACRLGLPTASEFAVVLRDKGRGDNGESKTRTKYLYRLAAEIVTGEPFEGYGNSHMERGKLLEPEARSLYAFLTDEPLQQIGFIRNGSKGASPDSFVGANGGLEVKTKQPDLMVETLLQDKFPPEFMAQCQGNIWVSEREWWDLAVYWPKLPLFAKRVYRDDAYIKKLSAAVDKFNAELAEVVEKVRRYGLKDAA